jgi:hypothetical protein
VREKLDEGGRGKRGFLRRRTKRPLTAACNKGKETSRKIKSCNTFRPFFVTTNSFSVIQNKTILKIKSSILLMAGYKG